MNAARAGDDDVARQRRKAQEVVDAGCQRLNPFQRSHASDDVVVDDHAECDQHVDVGEVGGKLGGVARPHELDVGKLLGDPLGVGLGVNFKDEELHQPFARFNSRAALLKQISARTRSSSATLSMKCPASSARSNG